MGPTAGLRVGPLKIHFKHSDPTKKVFAMAQLSPLSACAADQRTNRSGDRYGDVPGRNALPGSDSQMAHASDAQVVAVAIADSRAPVTVNVYRDRAIGNHLSRLNAYGESRGPQPLSKHPAWMQVLKQGLGHTPYCLEAVRDGDTQGFLTLAYVKSLLFGRFLVSLPYLNYGGIMTSDDAVARQLIDAACDLADTLRVRYLELRHETTIEHPRLQLCNASKVNMQRPLPATAEELWNDLPSKVRNQIRKGRKNELTVVWGGLELLGEFHQVFSHNMRDLGTPVYGRSLFRAVVNQFPDRAEFCVIRHGARPVAAALLLHGRDVTEVPSASSLRERNDTCANMLMYWHLLERAIERKQTVFDFGRCSVDGNTFRFKKQWGAEPQPAQWQSYSRYGNVGELNPHNPRFERAVRLWQRLPLSVSRLLGPAIVRGIP
jgi:FemAB-related protein (PEP-CTERM system-associated)